jgi:hypothetical protein
MQWLASGVALLLAVAIIAIGTLYILSPRRATLSFGLPLPENGTNIAWWLRLKGVRDIATGLTVLPFTVRGAPFGVGLVLFVNAIVPVGDMMLILGAKGSTRSALGMHGVTAVVMVLAAVPMMMGAR